MLRLRGAALCADGKGGDGMSEFKVYKDGLYYCSWPTRKEAVHWIADLIWEGEGDFKDYEIREVTE
jgi:hypothetical protein